MFSGKQSCVAPEYLNFVEWTMSSVLAKAAADKAFLAKIAKSAVTNCAQTCPSVPTANLLIEGAKSKIVALAEFSVQTMVVFVKNADSEFLTGNDSDNLVSALCWVIDGKAARLAKAAVEAMQVIKKAVGDETMVSKCHAALKKQLDEENKE